MDGVESYLPLLVTFGAPPPPPLFVFGGAASSPLPPLRLEELWSHP